MGSDMTDEVSKEIELSSLSNDQKTIAEAFRIALSLMNSEGRAKKLYALLSVLNAGDYARGLLRRTRQDAIERMLAKCNPDVPVTAEEREWLDAPPVGKELI
jgi:hypothetical protein